MTPARLLIFDDGQGDFGPMTDLRPAFDLRSGAWTNRQRIERVLGRAAEALRVPAALARLCGRENPRQMVNAPLPAGAWLLVNGRWTGADAVGAVCQLQADQALVDRQNHLVAAVVDHQRAAPLLAGGLPASSADFLRLQASGNLLLERPWHLLDHLEAVLQRDLDMLDLPPWMGQAGVHTVGGSARDFKVGPDARIHPGAVLNAEHGPVVIDQSALVGPGSVLEGPCYVGPHAQLAAHTYLRANSVVGPRCKAAGEISFSILHGYSNKAHLGFLGHSLVGQWVNLGAGTSVSNLKNTYSPVRVRLRPDQEAQDTGRMFQGAVIGDFVRTAIGTRIPTGASLGTGAMIALSGWAPRCARPLGFYSDEHPDGAAYAPDKFLATARTMMARRQVEMSPALEALLADLMGPGR